MRTDISYGKSSYFLNNKSDRPLNKILIVIVILGVLMYIATQFDNINNNELINYDYIAIVKEYIRGIENKVNTSKFGSLDTNTTYYFPITCVEPEKEVKSSIKFVDGQTYVVVTHGQLGFDYYWVSKDESNAGIHLTYEDSLDYDKLFSNVDKINTDVGVGGRDKIKILKNNCKIEDADEKNARLNIPDRGTMFDAEIKQDEETKPNEETKPDEEIKPNEEVPKKTTLYEVLQNEAEIGKYAEMYHGAHKDSMYGTGGKRIYYWNSSNSENINIILDKNNVIFAGFCWQTVRTTDTGGVKMIYNGLPSSDGKCNNKGKSAQIGTSEFNSSDTSPAYAGYMYNPTSATKYMSKYEHPNFPTGSYKFGTSFTYQNGKYKLKNIIEFPTWSSSYGKINNHHYTCFNEKGECATLYYIYYSDGYWMRYINLSEGKSVEDALNEMLWSDNVNLEDSKIKKVIDTWYEKNMKNYSSYLEDTIFCNDRSIVELNGWDPNGGNMTTYNSLYFKNKSINLDLSCINDTDKFSVSNPKAKLKYKVGLISNPEMNLIGRDYSFGTGESYWLASPIKFNERVNAHYIGSNGWLTSEGDNSVSIVRGVRPAISLKPGTEYISGDGSKDKPYIVK